MSHGRYVLSGKQNLVMELPLGNLQKSANLFNTRLLHPFHQPSPQGLSCMNDQRLVHHKVEIHARTGTTIDLGKTETG